MKGKNLRKEVRVWKAAEVKDTEEFWAMLETTSLWLHSFKDCHFSPTVVCSLDIGTGMVGLT